MKTFGKTVLKIFKIFIALLISMLVMAVIAIIIVNAIVRSASSGRILSVQEAAGIEDVECIIVLGCQVRKGEPSPMLGDRIITGCDVYKTGVAPLILMSGDSKSKHYDETKVMSRVAAENGVPKEAIIEDGYGLSTYESIFRAAKVNGYKKVIIVTQKYHLYRAMYIAKQYGLDAYGVSADTRVYAGQFFRETREIAARCKDLVYCIFSPETEFGITPWKRQ